MRAASPKLPVVRSPSRPAEAAACPRKSSSAYQTASFSPVRYDTTSVTAVTSKNTSGRTQLSEPPVNTRARARNTPSSSSIHDIVGCDEPRSAAPNDLDAGREHQVGGDQRHHLAGVAVDEPENDDDGGEEHPQPLDDGQTVRQPDVLARAPDDVHRKRRKSPGRSARLGSRRSIRPWTARNTSTAAISTSRRRERPLGDRPRGARPVPHLRPGAAGGGAASICAGGRRVGHRARLPVTLLPPARPSATRRDHRTGGRRQRRRRRQQLVGRRSRRRHVGWRPGRRPPGAAADGATAAATGRRARAGADDGRGKRRRASVSLVRRRSRGRRRGARRASGGSRGGRRLGGRGGRHRLAARDGAVRLPAHVADAVGAAVIAAVIVRPAARRAVGEAGRGRHRGARRPQCPAGRPPSSALARTLGRDGEDARTGMHETLVATIGSPGCET